tara:strand:+ start:4222 stop:4608 length:387 start_codon:yes stop_codon:yes gene_type:complete
METRKIRSDSFYLPSIPETPQKKEENSDFSASESSTEKNSDLSSMESSTENKVKKRLFQSPMNDYQEEENKKNQEDVLFSLMLNILFFYILFNGLNAFMCVIIFISFEFKLKKEIQDRIYISNLFFKD